MFILDMVDVCNDLAVLRTIKFIKNLLEVIRVLVPIILIIMCIIDFCKALFAGEDKQITSAMIKRFMSAIIIFFIVPVVNMIFELLGESHVDASECWNNANDSNIEVLAANEKAKLEAEKEEAKKIAEEKYNKRQQEIENAKNKALQTETTENSNSGINASVENYIYYNQGDYAYVGFCKNGKTVQSSGCSAASFAMIASNLVSQNYNPENVANWMCSNIHDNGALVADKLINTKLLNQYGLNGERLFGNIGQSNTENAKQKILEALNQGKMIILYIPGHYVTLGSSSSNKIVWLDPGKRANNGIYTIDELWEKTKNYKNRCSNNGNCGWHGAFAYSKK